MMIYGPNAQNGIVMPEIPTIKDIEDTVKRVNIQQKPELWIRGEERMGENRRFRSFNLISDKSGNYV